MTTIAARVSLATTACRMNRIITTVTPTMGSLRTHQIVSVLGSLRPNRTISQMSSTQRLFSSTKPKLLKETVTIHFSLPDGKRKSATAKLGDNLLDVVLDNNLDIDGYGACEGTLACSTCHLIFKQPDFDKLTSKPTDEELDMLDLAYGLKDTSRLGCQVIVTKDMDGWEVTVPSGVADARSV